MIKMANNFAKMHQNLQRGANVRREDRRTKPGTSTTTAATSQRSVQSNGAEGSSSGKQNKYLGARRRCGKWVSEILEPGKSTRIWLGTYSTQEMAAAAYDVASLTLKGPDTALNFPNPILSYPVPASNSASDIRAAAASAAEGLRLRSDWESSNNNQREKEEEEEDQEKNDETLCRTHTTCSDDEDEFLDEEALFYMPNLLRNMAQGMLMSPPRIQSKPSSDWDESGRGPGGGDGLWSYSYT
jgi:hypothetical protein